MGDIFVNEVYVGTCANSKKFVDNFRSGRRSGSIGQEYNIYFDEEQDFIYIESGPGRVRRPLIIVEKGVSKLTSALVKELKSGFYWISRFS